ncbi:PAS domain-containing sensor histidine kinase [Methanolobus mangrovi]|uniref:histidine kinase n=1 Tax=Methanolobus mangrovi TaxID=3072977 RepID=A0AA51UGW2_9EURY|nr:PAS domain-containing sensor histidine kinase [Methanolobus mangrovi]WMW21476.1 PAS domain-containing sensor histidine kinase [Methanolobus mangrovi]
MVQVKKEGSCSDSYGNDVCSFSGIESQNDHGSSTEQSEFATESCITDTAASRIDGYLCISSSGQIMEANEAYCQLTGYSREDLLKMTLDDLDASEYRDDLVDNLHNIIKQNKGRLEFNHRTKDGRLLDLDVSATYVEFPNPFFIFILKDVTGLNQTDRFFLEKGGTYRSLFKHNKAIMLLINPENFDIIDANIAACKYYGWPLEEITCKKIHEINTLSPKGVRNEMEKAVDEKRNYFLFKHKLANGKIRDVEVYSSPVIVNSQNLLYSVIHDITERKLAEDELKTREMQLRTAQKIGHIGSWGIDLNSGGVFASEEAFRIYGLNVKTLTVGDIQKVTLPEYRPMMDEALKSLVREKIPYDIHFRIKRGVDGAIRDIHSVAEYYAGKNSVIGTIEDITERKKAEDALLHAKMVAEAASRTKDEFLATMSHELRTPLTSVIGFSDVLLDETFGSLDEKQTRYVNHISDAGKHLLKLINDVLDLSKVEAGKMELQYEIFSVSDAINEVQILISPLVQDKNIQMDVEVDPQLGKINADRTKFKQILYNLASNAIKFTPDRGSVRIHARCSDSVVLASVKDTGIGISKEDINKLFHPFKQLNSYLANESAGTGLGLALVKKFVELHDGRIWVESEVGEGSTFTFTIPVGSMQQKER